LDIEGLDTASALRRLTGDQALYLRILRKFSSGQRETGAHLQAALAKDDATTARRMAHTLKGLAGTIGAPVLEAKAEALEGALRKGADTAAIHPLVDALLPELDRVLSAVATHIGQPETPASIEAPQMDKTSADQLRLNLERLLDAGDPDAGEILAEHASLLEACWGADYRMIADAVDNFDFETALAALRRVHRFPG
jgi:HPt (histidine-containing phosphotransfer) domain-containing protein